MNATPLVGVSSWSVTSPGGMSKVHAAEAKTSKRPSARPEWVVTAVAGVRGLSGNWWPGPVADRAMPR